MKIILTLFALCCLLQGCVPPDAYQGNRGAPARKSKESDTHLGMRYLIGRGVPQNDEKAFHYLLKAANEDDPLAENEVAYLYATGRGTEKDEAKALLYYQKDANHGLSSAQYNLGLLYQYGMGTSIDMTKACALFLKAKQAGFGPAKKTYQTHCQAKQT